MCIEKTREEFKNDENLELAQMKIDGVELSYDVKQRIKSLEGY
jgi:hypothetical protein